MEQWLRLIEVQPELREGDKWVTFLISKFHLFILLLKNLIFELSDVCVTRVLLLMGFWCF